MLNKILAENPSLLTGAVNGMGTARIVFQYLTLLLVCLILFGGCTREGGRLVAYDCVYDQQCEDGQICSTGGRCIYPPDECESDDQCGGDLICINRTCIEAFCSSDCECMVDSICESGRCDSTVTQCYKDSDCPENMLCGYNNADECLAKRCMYGECIDDSECVDPSICLRNVCDSPECFYDTDCFGAGFCYYFRCTDDQCTFSSECSPGYICYHNVCQVFACTKPEECPDGFACVDNLCSVVNCSDTSDNCLAGYMCDGAKCTMIKCVDDSDCLPIEECQNNKCVLDLK